MKKTIFPKRHSKSFWCMTRPILKSLISILRPARSYRFITMTSRAGDTTMPAKPGDVVISEIAEPHGLRAKTDLRLLVTIAPPI
jgi:hypothetical protein